MCVFQFCLCDSRSRKTVAFGKIIHFAAKTIFAFVLKISMKSLLTIIFLLFTIQISLANDGVFYANGNTLMPLQETEVQLKKEILKFYLVDYQYANVDVYFEFYNPNEAKTVTVGFVTPPADGDVTDEEAKFPFISNFTVNVNGKTIRSKTKRLKETTFTLERKEEESSKEDYFVYYFPVTFKKGLNIIRHTYRYKGGSSVELSRDFDYQITTGKLWANKQIDDFELQIHLDNGIFAVPARFIKNADETIYGKNKNLADWKIVGDGIIQNDTRQWFGEESQAVRMVHLNSGYLSFTAKNFKPDYDIAFGEYNWGAGWEDIWCNYGQECFEPESLKKAVQFFSVNPDWQLNAEDFKDFTKKDFKYVRNYAYAIRGIYFNDKEIRDFYSQFFWYTPNKKLKPENLKLSKAESNFLKRLKLIEAKLKFVN